MITNNIIYIQKPLNNIFLVCWLGLFYFGLFFVKQWRRSWKEHLKVTFSMYRVDFKSYRSCHTLLVSFLIISHFNISLCSTLHFFFGLVWFVVLIFVPLFYLQEKCWNMWVNTFIIHEWIPLYLYTFFFISVRKMYPIILQVYF